MRQNMKMIMMKSCAMEFHFSRKDASAPAMSMYTSEWNSAVRSVYSELIQARDITPDQALDNLKSEASTIFE